MVLFEALTMEIPYDGLHIGQLVVLVSQQEQRPQLWHPEDEHEKAAQELMARCWAHVPEERPKAAMLVKDLAKIIASIPDGR
jgi:hypothetical protein